MLIYAYVFLYYNVHDDNCKGLKQIFQDEISTNSPLSKICLCLITPI